MRKEPDGNCTSFSLFGAETATKIEVRSSPKKAKSNALVIVKRDGQAESRIRTHHILVHSLNFGPVRFPFSRSTNTGWRLRFLQLPNPRGIYGHDVSQTTPFQYWAKKSKTRLLAITGLSDFLFLPSLARFKPVHRV